MAFDQSKSSEEMSPLALRWLCLLLCVTVHGVAGTTSDSYLSRGECDDAITLHDHLEAEVELPVGESLRFIYEVPTNITSEELTLFISVDFDYPGHDGVLSSLTCDGEERLISYVPVSDEPIDVVSGETYFFALSTSDSSIVNTLSTDVWVTLRDATSGDQIYCGSREECEDYVELFDNTRTVWLDVAEDEFYTFRYTILASGALNATSDTAVDDARRWFKIDLRTAVHDLDLYAKRGSLPTLTDYDWRATESGLVSGTLVTDQSLAAGEWFIRVYGEDLAMFTSTATFRIYVSDDGDFDWSGGTIAGINICSMVLIIAALFS